VTVSPERLETLDLLPTFRGRPRGFTAAASWVLSGDIRLQAGFAPNEDLVAAGRSSADAVLQETDCFGVDQPPPLPPPHQHHGHSPTG
jgi:hypothetical protein